MPKLCLPTTTTPTQLPMHADIKNQISLGTHTHLSRLASGETRVTRT
jgi:hypothetical protein